MGERSREACFCKAAPTVVISDIESVATSETSATCLSMEASSRREFKFAETQVFTAWGSAISDAVQILDLHQLFHDPIGLRRICSWSKNSFDHACIHFDSMS